MAGCSNNESPFCGVLPLLALRQDRLAAGDVTPTHSASYTAIPAEIHGVEKVEVVSEEPPLSLALSQAEAALHNGEEKKNTLKEQLHTLNTQLAEIMTVNEGLKADIKKAQNSSQRVSLVQLQHRQTYKLRADDLRKEVEKFGSTELKAVEQEVHDLSAAQRTITADLTSQIKEYMALLECLNVKETQLHGEVWRLEDEATLLEGKSVLWRQFEAASIRTGEENTQRHQHTQAALEEMTHTLTHLNTKAKEVCVTLASHTITPHSPQRLSQPHSPT